MQKVIKHPQTKMDKHEFHTLIGKSIEELKPLVSLLTDPTTQIKSFPTTAFYFSLKEGISFEFDQSKKLTSVHCYSGIEKPFSKYDGPLPFGLKLSFKAWEVVAKFGDTSKKGGGKIPVWLEYPRLGMQISFQGPSWEDPNNVIVSVCVFSPELSKVKECATCLKTEPKEDCKGCGLVSYCSEKCKAIHAKSHSKFCSL